MEKSNPLVSVIIVNFNGIDFLKNCLSSLFEADYQNFECIIVDNNSSDESVEYVEDNFPKIKIIKLEQNMGFAKPNNIGAKKAKGEFLLFLNNDTIPKHDFISKLIEAMNQDPKIAICQSLLLKEDETVDSAGDFIDTLGRAYSSKKIPNRNSPILSARGASMMIRTDIFFDLGGFDRTFFVSYEDVDLGWRTWLLGYKVHIVPNSIVYHLAGQTIKKMKQEIQFHGYKNSLVLRLTNFEFSFALKSTFILFFVILMRRFFKIEVIKDPKIFQFTPSMSVMFSAFYWIIKNLKYVLNKRKIVNLKRKISTKKLIEMGLITKY